MEPRREEPPEDRVFETETEPRRVVEHNFEGRSWGRLFVEVPTLIVAAAAREAFGYRGIGEG